MVQLKDPLVLEVLLGQEVLVVEEVLMVLIQVQDKED